MVITPYPLISDTSRRHKGSGVGEIVSGLAHPEDDLLIDDCVSQRQDERQSGAAEPPAVNDVGLCSGRLAVRGVQKCHVVITGCIPLMSYKSVQIERR